MREAVFHRTYEEVPHTTTIELKSVARQSNGRLYLKFKLSVLSENQQRLIIGSKGRNIDFIKNLFTKQYVKYKGEKPDLEVQVAILSKQQRRIANTE